MTETSTLDRLAIRFETTAAHYISNREQLYKLLVSCALLTYVISIAWTVTVNAENYEMLFQYPRVGAWFIIGIATQLLLSFLALGVRSRLTAKRSTGITLAAIFLIANLCTLHIFIFLFGLYAFMNSAFRAYAEEFAPTWYRDLTKQLD